MTKRDQKVSIRVLSYSYNTAIAGWDLYTKFLEPTRQGLSRLSAKLRKEPGNEAEPLQVRWGAPLKSRGLGVGVRCRVVGLQGCRVWGFRVLGFRAKV